MIKSKAFDWRMLTKVKDHTLSKLTPQELVRSINVASTRLPFFHPVRNARDSGKGAHSCGAQLAKGAGMGYFEHGCTIIVLAPPQCRLIAGVAEDRRICMGETLMAL